MESSGFQFSATLEPLGQHHQGLNDLGLKIVLLKIESLTLPQAAQVVRPDR
jgi:hypothetical protein